MTDDCRHCWHDTGETVHENPLQYREVCCHCGETRIYTPPPPIPYDHRIIIHGAHLPNAHYHRLNGKLVGITVG